MNRGAPSSLYVLPCDHRDILRAFWEAHRPGGFTVGDQWVTYAKEIVLEGLWHAVDSGRAAAKSVALLMDEELGAPVLQRARDLGITRFVPVDDGTVGDYVIQYGADFPHHIERVAPDFVQTLINYNPESAAAPRQLASIAPLFDWLADNPHEFMLELQVLPTEEQIGAAGREAWMARHRPALICRAIAELHARGARPSVWKVEPMPDAGAYAAAVAAMREGGRDHVTAIVLGGGASTEAVDASFRICAQVDGFVGFAVGRSVWAEGIGNLAKGAWTGPRAAASISDKFSHFVEVFEQAKAKNRKSAVDA